MQEALVFIAPVTLFSAYDNPLLGVANVVLSSLLAKITKTKFLQNSSVENNLISGLQITTSTNRVTRILLGVVHAIATAKLALKGQKDLNKNIKENDGKITFGGLLWQTYNLFGVLLLGLVAGTWLSTGYYGQ
tara:strand:+ start:122 stop:520 length:399 start_codon:yes stop_codon:yes gene_type:complete